MVRCQASVSRSVNDRERRFASGSRGLFSSPIPVWTGFPLTQLEPKAQVFPLDVHPGALVQAGSAGQAARIDAQPAPEPPHPEIYFLSPLKTLTTV